MPGSADLPVLSVKEMAEQLGEPQTKLYRHVKMLETVGLIEVAATRLVSGIVEQRYRASQRDLVFRGPGLQRLSGPIVDDAEAAVGNALDVYRRQLFDAIRAGRLPGDDVTSVQAFRKPMIMIGAGRVSAARASSIRARLEEILAELDGGNDPEGVPVNVLLSYYSPDDAGPHRNEST
jgi:DNA-binding transcriptional ArsR family regulator